MNEKKRFFDVHIACCHFKVVVGLSAILCGAGCSAPVVVSGPSDYLDPSAFGKTNLLKAPTALAEALRVYGERYDLEKRQFRIDMRRFPGKWSIQFIRLPEAPDLVRIIEVYDDGRVELL